MSLGVGIGLLLALACAFVSVLGFLWKHKGAVQAPAVDWKRPIGSSIALFRSGWYTLGILVAMGAWGFHVGALALAPISLVQSVIAGGLVFLTVLADRLFGHNVTRREWIGVGLTAAGLAFLAATLDGSAGEAHSDYDPAVLIVYVAGLSLLAVGAWRSAAAGAGATALALSAGLMWGASDVSIKALSGRLDDGVAAVLIHPLALTILLLSLVGLLVSAGSLQRGKAVPVIAVTSAAANICTIASGPIVFGEPLPDDPAGVMLRILAFGLVIAAAALTPPPMAERELEAATG